MKIFIVAGKSGSGKMEVAKFINEYYIYKLKKNVVTSYSKYIRSFAMELTDWDGDPLKKPREFLQNFGMKVRNFDKDFFNRRMIEDISVYELDGVENVIISDARMPDEIDKIKDNFDDVYSFYIENQFAKSNLTAEQLAHITETALEGYDGFDYVLANEELNELKDKIFKILDGIEVNG